MASTVKQQQSSIKSVKFKDL